MRTMYRELSAFIKIENGPCNEYVNDMADPSAMILRKYLAAWIHAKPPLKRTLKNIR